METNPDSKLTASKNAETLNTQNPGQSQPIISFSILWQRCLKLARQGKQEELRALLRKYGVGKLTELPKEKYEEVLMEVEKWGKPEFAGHYFMYATTKFKPEVVDKNCINITDPKEFYSGCYGRAAVKFFSYNREGNLGIGCSLYNIQKLEEGEELSTHISAAEDFRQPIES